MKWLGQSGKLPSVADVSSGERKVRCYKSNISPLSLSSSVRNVFLLGRKAVEPSVKLCRTNFMRKNMLLAISLSDAKIPLKAKVGAKMDVLNHEGSCKNMLHMV